MNIHDQESRISYLLLEAHNIVSQYDRSKYMSIYKKNFTALFESLSDDLSYNQQIPCLIQSNKFARLNRIYEELNSYDESVIKPLNESIEQPFQKFNADTFKNLINDTLNRMKKNDDFKVLPPDILKIKRDLHIPVCVWGFDINQVLTLRPNAFSLVYDRTFKKVIIVNYAQNGKEQVGDLEVYDILSDSLLGNDKLQPILAGINSKIKADTFTKSNYLDILKLVFGNNLIVIYKDINKLDFKFTDNLFNDMKRKAQPTAL
jgi:hypothetical protein